MSSESIKNNDSGYERVLLVKPTLYVYRIPPITSASRGFCASDWNLANPDWTGRIRVISINDEIFIYIEDATTGQLYAKAAVAAYPGPQVQPVSDSSRYFVVKVVSDTGRTALIGIGFADGSDSFDLNVALRDHFVSLQHAEKDKEDAKNNFDRPKLDLSLKGDIKVSLNIGKSFKNVPASKSTDGTSKLAAVSSESFLLPPPPGSKLKK